MILRLKKMLEPGVYLGRFVRYEEVDTRFGEALKFVYELETGQEVTELVNQSYSARSKLGRRVKTLLGSMPEELRLADMIGKPVRLNLVEQDNSDYLKVDSVTLAPELGMLPDTNEAEEFNAAIPF